jgi:bleomycin hydrolase
MFTEFSSVDIVHSVALLEGYVNAVTEQSRCVIPDDTLCSKQNIHIVKGHPMNRLFPVGLLLLAVLASSVIAQPGGITPTLIEQFEKDFAKLDHADRVINAVTNNSIKDLSLNREIITSHDDRFNVKVKSSEIINQRRTGRCWMFASTNVFAPKVMTKLELSDFDLSKSYLAFWDKLEKSNRFLETMIALRDKSLEDRSLAMYIQYPFGDGGWFEYFEALIGKYGVIPASAMPETKQSSSTGQINKLIISKLRQAAAEVRRLHEDGRKESELRIFKEGVLSDIYSLLVFNYGAPPSEFVFRYEKEEDSVKVFIEEEHTPKSFFTTYFGESMPDYVALCHNPAKEMNTLYKLESARNVQEVADIQTLNLPIEKLKEYTLSTLLDSQIVWFACDVGKDNFNDSGIFAIDVYDYNSTFGIDFKMSKADRINFMDMSPNHAMVITGVDTATDGTPRKWLVENSWGADKGKKGYWTMYDGWFDEWVLLVIVERRFLEPEVAAMFDQTPVIIEDWQPFFAALRNLE